LLKRTQEKDHICYDIGNDSVKLTIGDETYHLGRVDIKIKRYHHKVQIILDDMTCHVAPMPIFLNQRHKKETK